MSRVGEGRQAGASRSAMHPNMWWAFLAAVAAALCVPMAINHGPVMYFDTLAHVQQGTQQVIEPLDRLRGRPVAARPAAVPATYKAERSPFYSGFMIFPFGRGNVHLVAALQALWVAATLTMFLMARRTRPRDAVWIAGSLLVLSPVAIVTNVAIPDIFAGIMCLSCGALLCYGATMGRAQRLGWGANLAVAAAMHQAFGVVALAVAALFLLFARRLGVGRRGAVTALGAALLGAVLLLVVNSPVLGVRRGANTTAPFLLGRLMGDGTAPRVLATDCPATHWATCRYLAVSPLSENDFLWGGGVDVARPYPGYNQLTPTQQLAIKREAGTIVARTLVRYWPVQIPITLGNIVRQFLDVDLGEFRQTDKLMLKYGVTPRGGWAHGTLIRKHPVVLLVLSRWFSLTYWLSLAVAVRFAVGWWRQPGGVGADGRFAGVCLLFLLFNAGLCGAAAGVFGRYEARFAWPFMLAVVILVLQSMPVRRRSIAAPLATAH